MNIAKQNFSIIYRSKLDILKGIIGSTQSFMKQEISEDEGLVSFMQDTLFELKRNVARARIQKKLDFNRKSSKTS